MLFASFSQAVRRTWPAPWPRSPLALLLALALVGSAGSSLRASSGQAVEAPAAQEHAAAAPQGQAGAGAAPQEHGGAGHGEAAEAEHAEGALPTIVTSTMEMATGTGAAAQMASTTAAFRFQFH